MSSVKTKISFAASVGSALMLSAPRMMSTETTVAYQCNFVSNSSATIWDSSKFSQSSLILGPNVHEKWGAATNIRFKELAHKDVMDQLTPSEWAKLDSLSALRREALFPRNADQILWQRKQNAITDKLLSALKEYVEFHNFPR